MKLSVQLQLKPDQSQANSLRQTLQRANEAANYANRIAWESQTFGQFHLHKLVYTSLRSQFGLPAQLAVRVIAKVADAYKLDKSSRRTFKPYGAIAYDSRNFSLFVNKSLASLSTLQGRVKIPFVCGQRQRDLLQYCFGEADLVYRQRKCYLFVTVSVEEPPPQLFNQALGVDLGIANIATDSDGQSYNGEELTKTRQRYSKLRQDLQSCDTKSARRHLQRLSHKEKNFAKTLNHTIAKRIVQKAKDTSRMIALEDLGGIRKATVRKAQRSLHGSWSFFQLRNFVNYKAKLVGVPVALVNPAYTSQTCPECCHVAKGNRPTQNSFKCQACGHAGHADTIAARNIAARATVNWPIVGNCVKVSHSLPASPVL